MRIVTFDDIIKLNITPIQCVKWVEEALKIKYDVSLPPKISITLNEGKVFFNSMPCYIPSINKFGLKEVSRFPDRNPSISGEILLYDASNGDLLALMDGDWITAMRTGAVAATAINLLKKNNALDYAFIGLGNTARATLLCLLDSNPHRTFNIKLLKYKDQAARFVKRFEKYQNVKFTIVDSNESLIKNTDVIVSCVSVAENYIGKDEWFDEGVLVVPIHTRGFQNCDLFFDKVFADDTGHVRNFKYFDRFKQFNEISKVLLETKKGRENNKERILSYNIGLALHDVYFASKIHNLLIGDNDSKYDLKKPTQKFWV